MQKVSDLFIKNIQNLPIWVKQVIAKEILSDLSHHLTDFTSFINTDVIFQYLCPKTSVIGQKELESKSMALSEAHYTFLQDATGQNTIFEITLKNNWTFADTAKIFIKLYESEFITISKRDEGVNIVIAMFIAGRIRTGEFLKKIGKIDAKQLEQALRYQKELQEEGHHIKMASILIKMGYITDQGLDSLFMLKEESRKHMPQGMGFTSFKLDNPNQEDDYVQRLQKELSRLENENKIMKKRLRQLLNMD